MEAVLRSLLVRPRGCPLLKIVGWGVAIVVIIGLLVITGILKAIF
jgi:hypothetical protein